MNILSALVVRVLDLRMAYATDFLPQTIQKKFLCYCRSLLIKIKIQKIRENLRTGK